MNYRDIFKEVLATDNSQTVEESIKNEEVEKDEYAEERQGFYEAYVEDTLKYIEDLKGKVSDDKTKKMLDGLHKFLDENGFLTDEQQQALGSITKKAKK